MRKLFRTILNSGFSAFEPIGLQGRIRYSVLLFIQCGLVLFVVSGCSVGRQLPTPEDEIRLVDPSLSSDGKQLLFSLSYQGRVHRLGRLDLEADELEMFFDLPINRSWRSPLYLPDGKTILATSSCPDGDCAGEAEGRHLTLIDMATRRFKLITSGRASNDSPSISYYNRRVIFSSKSADKNLNTSGYAFIESINLNTGRIRSVFPSPTLKTQFLYASQVFEIGRNEFVFSAIAPNKNEYLKTYTKKLDKEYEDAAYRLNPDQGITPFEENQNFVMAQLRSSRYGKRMVFIDRSRTKPSDDQGYYNYDLYLIESGRVKQITDLQTLMHDPYVSRDGSRVTFLADETKKLAWDVWVMDLPDGTPRKTGLRERIRREIEKENAPDGGVS